MGASFIRKKSHYLELLLPRACITIFINLILTSLWLNILYQNPIFTFVRLIKNVVMFPIDVILLYTILKSAERVKKQ